MHMHGSEVLFVTILNGLDPFGNPIDSVPASDIFGFSDQLPVLIHQNKAKKSYNQFVPGWLKYWDMYLTIDSVSVHH